MAKILSLRLNYKGKFLDYAKEGKEIKRKFLIGSNKHLQWQILDPAFPDKHTFIQKKGGEYVMQLPPNAQLTCERGSDTLDTQYLKQNKLLDGNELVLKEDIEGTVTIAPNWSVDFDFREPWLVVLTPEEQAIVAQYARRPKPDSVSKFNRTIIWLVLILTIIFLFIFDLVLKPEYRRFQTVEDIVQSRQDDAQKVVPDITPSSELVLDEPEVPDKTAATQAKPTGRPRRTGTRTGSSSLTSALQGFDAGAVGTAPALQIATVAEGFYAGRPGGTGGGTGPGISGTGPGPGGGGGAGSSYNPSLTPSFGDVASVVGTGPSTGGYAQAPAGSQGVHVLGDASKLAPSGKAWGDVTKQKKVAASYSSKGISTVSEGSISSMDEDSRSKFTTIREQIQARQSQIEQAYRESQITQKVSFTITVYISANGAVRESVVVPSGSYPSSFVTRIKSIVDGWNFNVKEELAYQFKIRAG